MKDGLSDYSTAETQAPYDPAPIGASFAFRKRTVVFRPGCLSPLIVVAACCLSLTEGERVFGQAQQGEAAFGSWRDDKPGVRRLLTPQDLPAISKPTYGEAKVVARPAGAVPQVPDGFSVEPVTTSGLHKPRVIRVAPNGDLFVADTMFGSVHVLRMASGRAKPEKETVFASGLKQPFGIAFYPLGPNP
jgi:glucose/arabinose dehydrogenase